MHHLLISLLILTFFSCSAYAQSIEEEIRSLENSLKQFEYEQVLNRGSYLLEDQFLTQEDSLLIYTYMLNAAYNLNDMPATRAIMIDIIECDPGYTLDPRLNSPKIIEHFNAFREKYLAEQNTVIASDTSSALPVQNYDDFKPHYALVSVILPGSGHLFREKNLKGYLYTGVSGVLIGGIIYSAFMTETYKEDYMDASGQADYARLYNRYNRFYKIRNGMITGYTLFSLYALYDLFSGSAGEHLSFSAAVNPGSAGFQIRVRF